MKEEFVKTPAVDIDKPFSIENAGISYCDGNYAIYREKSDVAVIEYIMEGSGTIETKGKSFSAVKGDTYLLPPGSKHRYYSSADDPWVKIWINVTGSLANSLIETYGLDNQIIFKCNTKDLIEKFHGILKDDSLPLENLLSKCSICFHEILLFLFENSNCESGVSEDAQKIKNYIDSNISENISMDNLAKLVFKSPSQTIRIFKKQFGTTPYDYHMKNRITKAISLLGGTNMSVREIAFGLGFCDEHYFSSVFKKKTGKKPTEFRNIKK
ncbi:MAG: AraC family transcriptional regulator [Clostridia bacterium]|nr:AraC family transcriptional regulator [Clostridia bacterium]